jgi:hypothetical protein
MHEWLDEMADEVRDAKREAKKAVKKAATGKERVDSLANKRVSRLRTYSLFI